MMRLRVLDALLEGFLRTFGKGDEAFARAYVAEKFGHPVIALDFPSVGTIRFACPSRWSLSRARRMLSKEPETIAWIDCFSADDVFWDIGANIGVYSIYAAAKLGIRVLAFEPSHLNYGALNLTLAENGFDKSVSAMCTCISDTCRHDVIYSRGMLAGSARHSLDVPSDGGREEFKTLVRQGILTTSVDALVERFDATPPNHIKIDVDGMEVSVVRGAARTLMDPRLKSVLIEISEGHDEIQKTLERSGFELRLCHKKNYIYVRPSWTPQNLPTQV